MSSISGVIGRLFLTVFAFSLAGCGGKSGHHQDGTSGTISLSGAFALYPLANKWAEEFRKTYPDVRFSISAGGAGKGMADALAGAVDLGMISREIKPEERNLGAWSLAVTKDAVVAVINAENPHYATLKSRGLSAEEFRKIFITGEISTWGQALGTGSTDKITVYSRSDAAGAAATWAQYLGGREQDELKGIGVFGDPGLADAVRKDKTGIGYNNVIYVYDLNSKAKYPGMEVVPIDVDGDDQISPDEQFYDNMDQLVQAVSDGRFPSPPARELYFVSQGQPDREVVKTFLRWVLTDGQRFVSETGYMELSSEKIETELDKLQ